ncbi:PAS domain-containing protein [bacterium]|nr:PAS domain-containing protein [bacterium]
MDERAVQAPSEHLERLYIEVIDTPFKFSSPGTPVMIHAGCENGRYHICIRDHGRGMAAEQIASMGAFMQFERQQYEQQGTGLGLIIASQLVAKCRRRFYAGLRRVRARHTGRYLAAHRLILCVPPHRVTHGVHEDKMAFEFNPYALMAVFAGGVALALAAFIGSKRLGRGVVAFVMLMTAVAVWSVLHGLELMSADPNTKVQFGRLTYVGIVVVPAAWLVFVMAYTGRDHWITRRRLLLLAIEPAVVLLAVFTPLIPWEWMQVASFEGTLVRYDFGPLFWVHSAYSYALLLTAAGLLIGAFIRSPQLYRGQITLLLLGQFAPWIANALYITGLSPLPATVDLTPLGFTLTGLAVGWSLYRFRLMDISPVAYHVVFQNMVDAVFVLDTRSRIVDANPTALDLLRLPLNAILGKPGMLILRIGRRSPKTLPAHGGRP